MANPDDWADDITVPRTLGQMRIRAHAAFDPIWQSGKVTRSAAYHLLAAELGVPEKQAHFKEMTAAQIEIAIAACHRVASRL